MATVKFSNGNKVIWLDLKLLRGCDGNILFDHLYYQDIPDELISDAIAGEESDKDAMAIAHFVSNIVKSHRASPVELDYMRRDLVSMGVTNNHHYIRAFTYLGIYAVPFELSGYETIANYLVRLCKVRKPTNNIVEYNIRPEIVGLL